MHDKFEKLERLGRGAMGTVHRGHDLRRDEPVAIKVMHRPLWLRLHDRDDYWEQLHAAARLSTLRRERDMVRIRDVDRDCGWIVSDLMVGPVRSDQPVHPHIVAGILRQVLQPLGQLHTEYGQLHGAIHPGNLLHDQKGYVRLADPRGFAQDQGTPILDLFAALGRSATDPDAADGDGPEPPMGMPPAKYLAPEWFDADFGPIGPSADLYALGITALELLLGRQFSRFFRGVGPRSVNPIDSWIRWHRDPNRALPPATELVHDLPEDLARVLDGLTTKAVARRFESASSALEELRNYRTIIPIKVRRRAGKGEASDAEAERLGLPAPDRGPQLPAVRNVAAGTAEVPVPAPARNSVRRVGSQSPVRARPAPAPTIADYLASGVRAAQAHWRQNRLTQIAVTIVALIFAFLVLFPYHSGYGVQALFELENPKVRAQLTLSHVDRETRRVIFDLTNVELSQTEPLTKVLSPGPYQATVRAPEHRTLERELVVASRQENRNVLRLERKTRRLRIQNLDSSLPRDRIRVECQGTESALADLRVPVGVPSELTLKAPGYREYDFTITPDDGDGPFPVRVDPSREVQSEREVIVQTTPEGVPAQILVDGDRQAKARFTTTVGLHTFRAQAEGYLEDSQKIAVPEGPGPWPVQLRLSRPTRLVRIRTHHDAVVALRPHGRPQLAVRDGDEREFDVGQRLIVQARLAGLAVEPDRDVTVQAGEGAQVIEMPVDQPASLQLATFPYRLRRQRGGWFHSGFESAVYRELLRHKLPNFPVGFEDTKPPPASIVAPALRPLSFSLAAQAPLPLQAGMVAPASLPLQAGIIASAAQSQVLLDEATTQGKWKIERNRHKFNRRVMIRQNNKFVDSFYVSEVPVTWRHWVEVMGDADLPARARENVKRFLYEHQDEPASGIGFSRCSEFCRRLTEENRSSGQIGPDWEFTLPRAVEIEYLLKDSLSEANADGHFLAPGSGNVPKRDREDLIKKCVNSWLSVEHNLEAQRGRRRRLAVWDANLLTNQLGIRMGLVATWTTDHADAGGYSIAGPSFTTHPNEPAVLKWKEDWPPPAQFHLPNQRKFVLHDINGYWPWSNTNHSAEITPEDHVGMYLVLRNYTIHNPQFDDTKGSHDGNVSRPVEAARRLHVGR
jgi:serine/threonine protein kinase